MLQLKLRSKHECSKDSHNLSLVTITSLSFDFRPLGHGFLRVGCGREWETWFRKL